MKAELNATHATGWRVGALARSEIWLQANSDAVSLAALQAKKSDPATAGSFSPSARAQSWQGEGILVGTPWRKLGADGLWQWQADGILLRLRQLRVADLAGDLRYRGAGAYDFDLHSQRSDAGVTSPFLAASGTAGFATSLSLALTGHPAPGWCIQLRADDLLSRLQWPALASDTSAINSQVTNRSPDGSLNYASLIKGQKSVLQVTGQMGVKWQAQASWSPFDGNWQSGAATLRTTRKADINQAWIGWDSRDSAPAGQGWSVEFEPRWQAAKLELAWGGWQVLIASDGRGPNTLYRQLRIGWETDY